MNVLRNIFLGYLALAFLSSVVALVMGHGAEVTDREAETWEDPLAGLHEPDHDEFRDELST